MKQFYSVKTMFLWAVMLSMLWASSSLQTFAQTATLYPTSLEATINQCNGTTTKTFSIENRGGDELTYSNGITVYDDYRSGYVKNTYSNLYYSVGMVVVGNYIYSNNYSYKRVEKYDLSTHQVVSTFPISVSGSLSGITYDGQYLWVAMSSGIVYSYNLDGTATGSSFTFPFIWPTITFDGENFVAAQAFVSNPTIYTVNHSGKTIATYSTSDIGNLYGLTWVPEHKNGHLWVIDYYSYTLKQLNLSKGVAISVSSFGLPTWSYSIAHNGTDFLFGYYYGSLYQISDGINEKANSLFTLSSYTGTVNAGETKTVTATFNSNGLTSGSYYGVINVNTNDPVNTNQSIEFSLEVDGQPNINLSASALNFGNVILGVTKTDTVWIRNTGCSTLYIENMYNSTSNYSFSAEGESVAPQDSVALVITFDPSAIGAATDIFNIVTANDTKYIVLKGAGVAAPVLSVSTDTIDAEITCGGSVSKNFTIQNTGGTNLEYTVSSVGNINNVLAFTYGADYYQEYTNTIDAINQYFTNYTLTETNTNDPAVLKSALVGKNTLLFVEQETGSSNMYANIASVLQDFVNNGGNVIFCGDNYGYMLSAGLFTGSSYGDYNVTYTVNNSNHPLTKGLASTISYQNGTYPLNITNSKAVSLISNGNASFLAYMPYGKGKVVYIACDYYAYDNSAAQIVANAIKWTTPSASFVKLSSTSGIVKPGASTEIVATFSADSLSAGKKEISLYVSGNDPYNGLDTVVCRLTVKGAPVLDVSATNLSFGNVIKTTQLNDTIYVKNTGCDTLKVSNISGATSVFMLDKTAFNVMPFDSVAVVVTFAPTSVGRSSTPLEFTTNAGNASVALSGNGIGAPVVTVDADTIKFSVSGCGASDTKSFTISNTTGLSNLTYSIEKEGIPVYSSTNKQTYTGSGTTTTHEFTGIPAGTESVEIVVSGAGDFSNGTSGEYATLVIEGEDYGQVSPIDNKGINDDIEYTKTYSIPASKVAQWLADGKLSVQVVNASEVDSWGVTDYHTVEVKASLASTLVVTPSTGSIAAGTSSSTITVNFNSSGLQAGTYLRHIIVNSNDLSTPSDTVACVFKISGEPVMSLSVTSINYGKAIIGTQQNDTLVIKNTGCDTLKVSDISGATSVFMLDKTAFNVMPFCSVAVAVTFAPTSVGSSSTTLHFTTNAGNTSVTLSGNGIGVPVVNINKSEIRNEVTQCGGLVTDTFKISNTGVTALTYELSGSESWIKFSTTSGSVAASASVAVVVTFDASSLTSGEYDSYITINTNDPSASERNIDCYHIVEGSPVISLSKKALNFKNIFVNAEGYSRLTISNTGCADLNISNITNNLSNFYTNTTALSIAPGESEDVIVYFKPSSVVTLYDTLRIYSNDKYMAILLSGSSILSGVVSVTSNTDNGYYNRGNEIELVVSFNNEISINTDNGTPSLGLNTTRAASATFVYSTGRELVFKYSVGFDENSNDLDYISTTALSLNGAVLTDDLGNTPSVTLPKVGTFASANSIVIDNVQPTVQITTSSSNPTPRKTIAVSFNFSETVTDFELSDITVSNGTASNLLSNETGTVWTANITAETVGVVTVNLSDYMVKDLAGNGNVAATQFSIDYDSALPLITLTSVAAITNSKPIVVSVTSNVAISGLELSDFVVNNGTVTSITEVTAGISWNVSVVPTAEGDVTVTLPANTVANNNSKANPESANIVVKYIIVPTVNFSVANITATSVDVTFTSNKNSTLYYVVRAKTEDVPSTEEVVSSVNILTLAKYTATVSTVGGLTSNTAYKAFAIVKDAFGNYSELSVAEFTTIGTGINDVTSVQINVYPNPVASVLYVDLGSVADATYSVYSTSGQKMASGDFNTKTKINLDNYAPATYILRIESSLGNTEYKIVKK